MNLAQLLVRSARRDGAQPAVYLGTSLLLDQRGLAARAASLAAALRRRGLAPGDRVALFMGNDPAMLELMWGCWWAGLAIVPINPKLHPKEALYIVAHSEASLLATDAHIGPGL